MKAVSASIIVLAGAVIFTRRDTELFGLTVGIIGFLAWVVAMIPGPNVEK
jgi:hypothetical protein